MNNSRKPFPHLRSYPSWVGMPGQRSRTPSPAHLSKLPSSKNRWSLSAALSFPTTSSAGSTGKPVRGVQTEFDQHQHYRHLYKHTHHRSQRCSGGKTEEHGGGGNGHFKMIGGPDHGRRSGVHVTEFQQPGQTVCQPEDQHCLDKEE